MSSTYIVLEIPDRPAVPRLLCEAESLADLMNRIEGIEVRKVALRQAALAAAANPHQGPYPLRPWRDPDTEEDGGETLHVVG